MLDKIVGIADSILSWKIKYSDIFLLDIKENTYIFRIFTKGEYLNILSLQNTIKDDIEDYIINNCILYPEDKSDIDKTLAGEIDYLIKTIIKLSGFAEYGDIFSDIEKYRESTKILDNQIVILICKAFPHLKPEDIDKFNYHKLLRYLTLSEAILDTKLIIEKPSDKIDFDKDNVEIKGSVFPKTNKNPNQEEK
jgi:hypothetical protein